MAADYYDLLGVSRTANADEIKKAFRAKAHQFHPDKSTGDAEKFKQINEAYQVLSDAEKRQQYDQYGQTFDQARRQGGAPGGDPFGGFGGFQGGNVDFGDLGDMFGDMFGFGGSTRATKQHRGRDIAVSMDVPFQYVIDGGEQRITIKRLLQCERCHGQGAEPGSDRATCTTCQGSGQVRQVQRTILGAMQSVQACPTCEGEGTTIKTRCDQCRGEGRIEKAEPLSVKIPPGISAGQKIRINGQGEAGRRGAPAGDLYITIIVAEDARFVRDGDDLTMTRSIPLSTATLGGTIDVPTVEKDVTLKIPNGTPSGREFIIRGQGVPHLRGRGRGDLRVKVEVVIPAKLSAKAKKLLKDLQAEGL